MKTIFLIMIAITAVFVAVVLICVKFAMEREKRIHTQGVKTMAVVSRLEKTRDTKADYCYVKYVDISGVEREGLLNTTLPIGRKVEIKYIPNKYDSVVFVSQTLDK